jgi:DNA-binding response OmpR family regulator
VKVLLVEDEARVAASLTVGLHAEGFIVVHAETGTEGLWQASENYFDVIILDIMLPEPSGYEILRRIRERQIWTPVLMLTAKDGEYDQADAFDLGADDYQTKPFSIVVLVARLRALVRRGAPQRPTVMTAGDLVLDPGRHLVTRGDRLTPSRPRSARKAANHSGRETSVYPGPSAMAASISWIMSIIHDIRRKSWSWGSG